MPDAMAIDSYPSADTASDRDRAIPPARVLSRDGSPTPPSTPPKKPARRSAPRHAKSLSAATPALPGPRPAWLLPEPRPLDVRADRPIYEALPLRLIAGPERIESGWWDDATATRDYFIAENAAGHLVWIYRERLIQPDRPAWFLQGLFG
jgi:protein ImuB